MQKLIETRTNGLVELPETLHLTNSLDAVKDSDVIVISVNSQGLRGLMRELQPFELKNKIFVLCMKGVEIETGMRLSQVCAAECDSSNAGCRLGWSRPCTGVCGRCAELHGH